VESQTARRAPARRNRSPRFARTVNTQKLLPIDPGSKRSPLELSHVQESALVTAVKTIFAARRWLRRKAPSILSGSQSRLATWEGGGAPTCSADLGAKLLPLLIPQAGYGIKFRCAACGNDARHHRHSQ